MKNSTVLLIIAFLISWHLMDVGQVLYSEGKNWATNGFWGFGSYALYHLGMYGMVASFFLLVYKLRKSENGTDRK
ncbi:MAG: hypothetical protein WC759_00095 [Candidatus Micrarchaeia archaeon]|jgi:hypothetical protein